MSMILWTLGVVASLTFIPPALACKNHKHGQGPLTEKTCLAFADLQMQIAYRRDRGYSAWSTSDLFTREVTCSDTREVIQTSVIDVYTEWENFSGKELHDMFLAACLRVREKDLHRATKPRAKRPPKQDPLPQWKSRS